MAHECPTCDARCDCTEDSGEECYHCEELEFEGASPKPLQIVAALIIGSYVAEWLTRYFLGHEIFWSAP